MTKIDLTNEEKFKLAVQLAQGFISKEAPQTVKEIKYGTPIEHKVSNYITHCYAGISQAIHDLKNPQQ